MKEGTQEGGNEIITLQKPRVIKKKVEEERRKIQLEVTVTLNIVPAMMRT